MDSAQPPEILIFKIAAVAPPVNFNSKRIFSSFKISGYIEFSRQFALLAVSYQLFINPYIKSGADRPEMKEYFFVFPGRG
jgi:hypothetical protein